MGDLPETINGWERASTVMLLGLCRGAFTWQDNTQSPFAAFGTHLRLYAMDLDGGVTDLTPATAYQRTSMSLATMSGSDTVTITGWAHGLVLGQKFVLDNATVAAIGGLTVNGTYAVGSVEGATSIRYTAPRRPARCCAGDRELY